MTCGHCGGANFAWASTCDHCGRSLTDQAASQETATAAPPVIFDGTYLDPEIEREQGFHAALQAATPRIFVTTVLVALNVAVFIAMVAGGAGALQPTPDTLVRWGGNYGPLTQSGQWWRLLTSAFVHVGILHLIMNMVVLWTGGRLIERLFGQVSFIALYGISAFGGSLTSIGVHPMTTSAGASGAIFGIYGGMIGYLIVCRASLPAGIRSTMIGSAVTFVAYNLVYGLALPHVDVAAHVGGLLAGFVSGAAMAVPMASPAAGRTWRAAMVTAAAIVLMAAAGMRLPRFDDWMSAVTVWLKDESSLDARFTEEAEKVGAKQVSPDQFADRIEREFIPEVMHQRARISALRLPAIERAKAAKVAAFLALKADALKLTAAAERTGDAAMHEQANQKTEEALAALLTIAPNPALTARVEQLSQSRRLQRSFTEEVKHLQQVEQSTNAAYNDAVKRFRANHYPPSEFALLVETNVLKPWDAERQRLATMAIPPGQQTARTRFLDYMALRTEAWQLVVSGVRTNDPKQIRRAAEKNAAAMKLLQQP